MNKGGACSFLIIAAKAVKSVLLASGGKLGSEALFSLPRSGREVKRSRAVYGFFFFTSRS